MHALFRRKAAHRRSFSAAEAHSKRPRPCMMQLTVDTQSVTALRSLAMHTCGEAMEFIRIEACDHGARVKVWVCMSRALTGQLVEAVMRALPGAEFGRMTCIDVRGGA